MSDDKKKRSAMVEVLRAAIKNCGLSYKEIGRRAGVDAYFPHICLAISAHFGLSDTATCRLAGRRASRRVAPVSVH